MWVSMAFVRSFLKIYNHPVFDKLSYSEVSSDEGLSSESLKSVTFSPGMIKKFEKRFNNGYNIFTDKSYVQWLRKFHPDYLPPSK